MSVLIQVGYTFSILHCSLKRQYDNMIVSFEHSQRNKDMVCGDVNLLVRVTHEIYQHKSPKSNDDFTVHGFLFMTEE
jgi:hypothetical protein